MKVSLNDNIIELQDTATLADLLAQNPATEPFAIAVNTKFVAKTEYANFKLQDGDLIDIVQAVVGG